MTILGAILLITGAGAPLWPLVWSGAWVYFAPDWALLALAPEPQKPAVPVPGEISWGRAFSGLPKITPAEELWRRYRTGSLSFRARRTIVARTISPDDVAPVVVTRDRWPEGVPLVVEVRLPRHRFSPEYIPDYLPGSERHVVVRPLFRKGRTWSSWRRAGLDGAAPCNWTSSLRFELGSPDGAFADVRIELHEALASASPASSHHPGGEGTADALDREEGPVWSHTFRLPVAIGGTIKDVLPHVDDEATTALVRGALTVHPVLPPTEAKPYHWTCSVEWRPPPELSGCGVGVRAELWAGGRRVASGPALLENRFGPTHRLLLDAEWPGPNAVASVEFPATLELRLTGDPLIALQDFGAARCWAGTFAMPVAVTAPQNP